MLFPSPLGFSRPFPGGVSHPQLKTEPRRLGFVWGADFPLPSRDRPIAVHYRPNPSPFHSVRTPSTPSYGFPSPKPSPGGSVLCGVQIPPSPYAIDPSRSTTASTPLHATPLGPPQPPPMVFSHPQSKTEPRQLGFVRGAGFPLPSRDRPIAVHYRLNSSPLHSVRTLQPPPQSKTEPRRLVLRGVDHLPPLANLRTRAPHTVSHHSLSPSVTAVSHPARRTKPPGLGFAFYFIFCIYFKLITCMFKVIIHE
jgi:hypothetical protein